MKCPECKKEGRRRKINGNHCCRFCLVGLEANGRLTSDKLFCGDLIKRLETHIHNRDQVRVFLDNPKERKMIYNLIDRSRTFLSSQSIDVGLSPTDFLMEVLEKEVYANNWWYSHINSHQMLQNKISTMAANRYRILKDEHHKKQAQTSMLNSLKGVEHIGQEFSAI